jgi:hypothetical protein
MICNQCKKEGLTSKIYRGECKTTAMYYPPFYDENGIQHTHDNNVKTINYACSNNHKWVEQRYNTCWCGWTDKK